MLLVAELLSKGEAVVNENKSGEVQDVLKMMRIEAFLSYAFVDREVKDEELTEGETKDCSKLEMYVKRENMESEYYEEVKVEGQKFKSSLLERNNSSSEVMQPFNKNKPETIEVVEECVKNVTEKQVRREAVKKTLKCDQCAFVHLKLQEVQI